MSFRQIIDSNLVRAFNLVKDLAIEATFIHKDGSSFDFASGTVSHATSQSTTLKVVVLNTEVNHKDKSLISKEIMFKSKDAPNISAYDSLVLEGATWKIGELVKGNGFILIMSIHKVV